LSDELQRVSGFYFFPNEMFHDSFCGEIEGYFFKGFVSYYSGEHRFCEEDADESVGGVKEEGGADDFWGFDGGKLAAFAFMFRMLLSRVPNFDQWERDKGFPVLKEPVLAHESEEWRRSASKQQLHLLSDNKRSSQLSHAAIA